MNNLPDKLNPNKISQGIQWYLNSLIYQSAAVILIYIIWIPLVPAYHAIFTWHVVLSTLGMIPFMLESFLIFSHDNSWSQTLTRKDKFWIHGVLITIGTILFVAGIVMEYYRKAQYPGVVHFTSVHAITGLISMILILVAFTCGFMAFNSAKLKACLPPVWIKFIHNILGQLGYIIGLVSIIYGYHTSWFVFYTSETSRYAATIVTIILTVWSVKTALKSAYQQIRSIVGA